MTVLAAPHLVTTIDGSTVELEADWGQQAQRAAEKHLEACWEWHRAEEDEDEDAMDAMDESPSIGAFCGCMTCEVRETLHAAVPFIEAGVLRDGPQAAT